MKAKEYAWTHVVSTGYVNVTPSYYGGYDPIGNRSSKVYVDSKPLHKQKDEAIALIKQHGVNWSKTDDIQTETYSKFAGTFAESCDEDVYLQGWMTLNNGQKLFWIAENLDASDAFRFMERASEMTEKFAEIFGK